MAKSLRAKIGIALGKMFLGKYKEQVRSTLDEMAIPGCGGIVFLGDSISAMGPWSLMFPDLPTRNYGIGGDTTTEMLLRLEPVIRIQPSKIFLLIGTNDIGREDTLEQISSNICSILDQLKAGIPNCQIVLQTLMPRQARYANQIKTVNARYAQIAKEHGIPLLDLHPLFDDGQGAIKTSVSNDEIHLLGAGYKIWAAALAPHLN